ncbi:hypothetical protein [Paracidobacterium acidisoli]|uniref:Peroxidase n=1 Tax=Paracidobacterium acidisoli TaxID=2303751 RepID=A0A372INH1_9BACT|nr:hypothetical protein [Paracidobacterium acidisoli]MBT9332111.1 hypothetical protein [Paracidobacterium acidisoli]
MTPQANLTVFAPVTAGREDALRSLLESMNTQPGAANALNGLIPFGALGELHFARLVILDDPTLGDCALYHLPRPNYPVYLALLCDFDGSFDAFVKKLVQVAAEGLRRIFTHCTDFDPALDLERWLKTHHVRPATCYVNWVGRTMLEVREESALTDALRAFMSANPAVANLEPRQLHQSLRNFAAAEQKAGRLTLTAEKATPLGWVIGNFLHLIGVPLALLALAPFLLLYAPIYVLLLRSKERSDPEFAPRPDAEHAARLSALEDYDVTNQFSAFGSIKPGLFRRWTLIFLLWVIDYTARHIYRHGRLARVNTIHFARWVFIDNKNRLFFASNYDGSLDSYMDDFINKVAFGLNVVFSNGIGYPTTNWLALDGAKDEQKFKYYIRRHELPTEVWYNAHPGLTALDLARNRLIRQGLENAAISEMELQQWIQIL